MECQEAPKQLTWVLHVLSHPHCVEQCDLFQLLKVNYSCQYSDSSSNLLVPVHKVKVLMW